MSLKTCSDMTEGIPLEPSLGLYLKPISRIKINVQLPRLSTPGQSISSWHVMEKLKDTARPDTFLYLKTLKIAPNVIKFEGELETRSACDRVLARLKAAGTLKVSGFAEKLQIRAAHAAVSGPTRHEWEAFYRDAKGVNEMKPGERPDTIHLEEIPSRWFSESSKSSKPSEKLLQKAFGTFGKIRRMEVRRNTIEQNSAFGKTSSLQSESMFEAYIQYEEYVEFSIAMDSLRGKKLLYKEPDGKVYTSDIKVDFDRTNYLSDKCIKLREAESKKLHVTSSERTKSGQEDTQNDPKLPSQQDLTSKEIQAEKRTDKDHCKKELNSLEEQEKSQTEAKLLLKELLCRAEKHKRAKDDLEQSAVGDVLREAKELKSSTKKPRAKQPETSSDQKRDKTAPSSLEDGKFPCVSGMQGSKQTHTETEECSKKRPLKDEGRDSPKSAKKQKTEPSKDRRKKTQPFYEVKKGKLQHKEKEIAATKQTRKVPHNSERTKEKDSRSHHKEKDRVSVQPKEKPRNKEREYSAPDQKPSGPHIGKRDKESVGERSGEESKNREKLILQEHILKEKLLKNLKAREEEKLRNREKLRRELAGQKVLKSVLVNFNNSLHKKS